MKDLPSGSPVLGRFTPCSSDSVMEKIRNHVGETADSGSSFHTISKALLQVLSPGGGLLVLALRLKPEAVRGKNQTNKNSRKRTMRLNMRRLALITACTICAKSRAYPQSVVDELRPLVKMTARRLVIAEQVALAKWDSGTPVEDVSREAQVILDAAKKGEARGLDRASVSDFFKAQIEANKLVQYSLLAEWRRVGRAPDHKAINLAGTIRPELDQVDTALIAELEETAGIRASASCRTDIAKAVGEFVSAHRKSLSPLKAIALDRALGAACR